MCVIAVVDTNYLPVGTLRMVVVVAPLLVSCVERHYKRIKDDITTERENIARMLPCVYFILLSILHFKYAHFVITLLSIFEKGTLLLLFLL